SKPGLPDQPQGQNECDSECRQPKPSQALALVIGHTHSRQQDDHCTNADRDERQYREPGEIDSGEAVRIHWTTAVSSTRVCRRLTGTVTATCRCARCSRRTCSICTPASIRSTDGCIREISGAG